MKNFLDDLYQLGKKNFSLSVLSSEIVGLEPLKYNVRISVSSIETPEGKIISNIEALNALGYLEALILETEEYKSSVPMMFDKSFNSLLVF